MKKTSFGILVLLAILGCLSLCGCAPYSSSFSALSFVHSNTAKSASMRFSSFEGTYVFKLKTDKDADSTLSYAGQVEGCDVTIYYDCGNAKESLFIVKAGESDAGSILLPKDSTVYVIVTTDGKATSGDFSFDIR